MLFCGVILIYAAVVTIIVKHWMTEMRIIDLCKVICYYVRVRTPWYHRELGNCNISWRHQHLALSKAPRIHKLTTKSSGLLSKFFTSDTETKEFISYILLNLAFFLDSQMKANPGSFFCRISNCVFRRPNFWVNQYKFSFFLSYTLICLNTKNFGKE